MATDNIKENLQVPERPEKYPDTTTLDRMGEVKEKSQVIGDFLTWLQRERKPRVWLCTWEKWPITDIEEFVPISETIETLLAEYFDIDLDEAERERMAVLEYARLSYGNA